MPSPFAHHPIYESKSGNVQCAGHVSSGKSACEIWLAEDVRSRVFDGELAQAFNEDLLSLEADGFDTKLLKKLVDEPEPDANMGDIGEAIADLFLIERLDARLPANRRRDLRSTKGSLPGADIVGYMPVGQGQFEFLFGEVKASSQLIHPPSVMATSGDGMPAQLVRIASITLVQKRLVMYLRARIASEMDRALYTSALARFAEGRFSLIGVLVRDTKPEIKDVAGAAVHLNAELPDGRTASIYALHLSVQSTEWPVHCAPKVKS